jgi:hypothetical protein
VTRFPLISVIWRSEDTVASASVMPQVLGFDISVEVEGKKLPEYQPELTHDEKRGVPVTTCWIPSEAGKVRLHLLLIGASHNDNHCKAFCIVVAPPPIPRAQTWTLMVQLDGATVNIEDSVYWKQAKGGTRFDYTRVSDNYVRPFLFTDIQLTGLSAVLFILTC